MCFRDVETSWYMSDETIFYQNFRFFFVGYSTLASRSGVAPKKYHDCVGPLNILQKYENEDIEQWFQILIKTLNLGNISKWFVRTFS